MEEKMTFEEANALLKSTIAKLSDQSITLNESIELYGKACDLLAYCLKELDNYRGQITDLHHALQERTRREVKK